MVNDDDDDDDAGEGVGGEFAVKNCCTPHGNRDVGSVAVVALAESLSFSCCSLAVAVAVVVRSRCRLHGRR